MGGPYWQPMYKREEIAAKRNQSLRGKNKSKPTRRHLMDKYLAIRDSQWELAVRLFRPGSFRSRWLVGFGAGWMESVEKKLRKLEAEMERLGPSEKASAD